MPGSGKDEGRRNVVIVTSLFAAFLVGAVLFCWVLFLWSLSVETTRENNIRIDVIFAGLAAIVATLFALPLAAVLCCAGWGYFLWHLPHGPREPLAAGGLVDEELIDGVGALAV